MNCPLHKKHQHLYIPSEVINATVQPSRPPTGPAGALRLDGEDKGMRSGMWDACCLLSAAHFQVTPLFVITSASPKASDKQTELFSLPKLPALPLAAPARVCFNDTPEEIHVHPEATAGATSAITLQDFKQKMTNLELIWKSRST